MDPLMFPRRFEPNQHIFSGHMRLPTFPNQLYHITSLDDMRPSAPSKNTCKKETLPTPQEKTKKRPRAEEEPDASDAVKQLRVEQNLKKQRLARKAELARHSRRKKKERLAELEIENSELRAQIERLMKQQKEDQETIRGLAEKEREARLSLDTQKEHQQCKSLINSRRGSLDSMSSLSSSPNSSMPSSPLTPFSEFTTSPLSELTTPPVLSTSGLPFLDIQSEWPDSMMQHPHPPPPPPIQQASKQQQEPPASVEDVVGALKRHLFSSLSPLDAPKSSFTPLQTQFLEWAFKQKDGFYDSKEGLWHSLFQHELGCSPNQLQQLKEARDAVRDTHAANASLTEVLGLLTTLLDKQSLAHQVHMEGLTHILTGQQLEALFDWINKFGLVCIKINV